ncbi:MAG: aspartate kinase [Peptoniphilaceae bacterium]|nr:aspartate kinase [Peptoniphilaceae bacterium]MDY6085897.1 aspartate kinase [Peptoniphilaceae bacterium]
MHVVKFGGSSCADAEQVSKIRQIVQDNPERTVVVVSAPGKRHAQDHKVTDMLYLAHQLFSIGMGGGEVFTAVGMRYAEIIEGLGLQFPLEAELEQIRDALSHGASEDYCASRGEYLCAKIVAEALNYRFVDAWDVIAFNEDRTLNYDETEKRCRERLTGERVVVPGFYGAMPDGEIVTFSRGGSDITGSVLAAALKADLYENWTDVSGFLATDPGIVQDPKTIDVITYDELHELSYMGAKVLHEDAVYPAHRAGVPIQIKNTNHPDAAGTRIVLKPEDDTPIVTGISGKKGFMAVEVTKRHGAGDTGFLRRLISVFEANDCGVEHIPSSIDTFSVLVREEPFRSKQKKILEEIDIFSEPDSIRVSDHIALLAVVGEGMADHPGVAARVFAALGREGISIKMILQGASELNIILCVDEKDFEPAVRALYREFFEEESK